MRLLAVVKNPVIIARYLAAAGEREDHLTGLKNRRAWMEEAQQQLQLAKRLKTPLSVLVFDVDHFKTVNHSHGHPAGDAVLRGLGQLRSQCLRVTDLPGRLGGEEFAVLVPGTDAKGALQVAEKLRNAIRSASKMPV